MAGQSKKTTTQPRTTDKAEGGITFHAELKEVKAYKAASLDKLYRIVLVTDESIVMTLGVLDADVLLNVNMDIEDNG